MVPDIKSLAWLSGQSNTTHFSGATLRIADGEFETPCRYHSEQSQRTGGGAITRLEIGLLGDLALFVEGAEIEIGAPKERHLLAVLTINRNSIVSNDRLIDALWTERLPNKPVTSLRAYVSNLRKVFQNAGVSHDVLRTETGGYSLRIEPEQVDAHRFEQLVAQAQSTSEAAPSSTRAQNLDEALELVRGDPLSDLAYAEFAQVEIQRLSEMILTAEELRAELAIESGLVREWLPRIGALVAAHPLREGIRASHMRALAKSGRQTEALRSYSQYRNMLVEEIGVEPGPAIRVLESEILNLSDYEQAPNDVPTDRESPDETMQSPSIGSPTDETISERRLVTVVAVGLGQTDPSSFDPEDMQALSDEARERWSSVIERHGAHLQTSPGGLHLAFFGVPVARERDAERAVLAALDLVADVPSTIAGVATSLVISERKGDDISVVGHAVHAAQRLCTSGHTDSVVVDEQTRSLVEERMVFETNPGSGHLVVIGTRDSNRLTSGEVTERPIVGREGELLLMRDRYERAMAGDGHTLLLEGDAGIGKTRLVDAFLESTADLKPTVFRIQCSPFHQQSALHPIIEHLERFASIAAADSIETRRSKWSAVVDASAPSVREARQLLGHWVLDDNAALAKMSVDPEIRRSSLLSAVQSHLGGDTPDKPTICIIEDVHWIDPSTKDLLEQMAERVSDRSLLIIVTFRTGEREAVEDLPHATNLQLSPLSRSGCLDIARSMSGNRALPAAVEDDLVDKADGIPLFVEEMTRSILDADDGVTDAVPASLQQSLAARLDRIPAAQATVQLAAALGSAFDLELLEHVSDKQSDEVLTDLEMLCEAGVLRRSAGGTPTFRFRHMLVRDVAHESLPRSTRSSHHQRIAETLEGLRPDVAQAEPGRLAQHWGEAGVIAKALHYLQRAAQRALAVSAPTEAIEIATEAAALFNEQSDLERAASQQRAVDLQLILGVAHTQLHGPASTEAQQIYDALFHAPKERFSDEQHFKSLWGKWYTVSTSREPSQMIPLAEQLFEFASSADDPVLLLEAHHVMWSTLLLAGDFPQARWHANEARSTYVADDHHALTSSYGGHDPGVCMWSVGGLAEWLVGDIRSAATSTCSAMELATELAHPYSLVEASFGPLMIGVLESNSAELRSQADLLDGLVADGLVPSTTKGYADGFRGVAHLFDGALDEGYSLLAEAAESWREFWGGYCYPLDGLFAQAAADRGDPGSGLAVLDSILDDQPTRATWWDAELHRIRAGILKTLEKPISQVVDELEFASNVAIQQGAIMLELRVHTDHVSYLHDLGLDAEDPIGRLRSVLDRLGRDQPHTDKARQLIGE